MFNHEDLIHRIIPYRLKALDALNLAIRLKSSWESPAQMKIYFNEKLRIVGNSDAYMNPAIEAGLIHCRALLDFLGLKVDPRNPAKLVTRSKKQAQSDDLFIEHFSGPMGPLAMVTPAEAVARYTGPAQEAELALASVLHTANKGLAHITSGLIFSATDINHLEITSRGIRALFQIHFYTPLGLPMPELGVTETA